MWKFLEKLRALPEGSRKAVGLFSSAFITAVLLISWLVFPVPHFGKLSDAEKERKSANELATPFSMIGAEIHNSLGGLKNQFSSLGGTKGIMSAVSALTGNSATGTATSTATSTDESTSTSTPNENVLPAQEASAVDNSASSTEHETADEAVATTTSATAD